MLTQGFKNVAEAPRAIFQQMGGGVCRPARLGELVAYSGRFLMNPRFTKFTPPYLFFVFFTVFFLKRHGTRGNGF